MGEQGAANSKQESVHLSTNLLITDHSFIEGLIDSLADGLMFNFLITDHGLTDNE